MAPRTLRIIRIVLAVLVVVGGAIVARSAGGGSEDPGVTVLDEGATPPPDDEGATPPPDDVGATLPLDDECVTGSVATVSTGELPRAAIETLQLIAAGGPYPYEQDDGTFQNREGHLPEQRRGYYREYTVETPGSDDRGARRIVVGECGDRWYTDDHYDSFSLIVGEP